MDWRCYLSRLTADPAPVSPVQNNTLSFRSSQLISSISGKAFGIFRTKWYFIGCVVGFEAASALAYHERVDCWATMLGIFGSGVYSGGLVFVSLITTASERHLYFSGIISIWGLGSVLGPAIGGAFAQSSPTWRWGFYVNLPLGAFFAPAFVFCLPNINPKEMSLVKKLRTQDWIGILVFKSVLRTTQWQSALGLNSH